MSFWDNIQKDLRDNLKEGLSIFREGSSVFTDKLEQFTGEGKKKYRVFNLNMKVQEEFANLGGQIYDLVMKNSKNPVGNRKVTSIISRIKKLEAEINKLEDKALKKPEKSAVKKTSTKKRTTKKTAAKRGTAKKTKTGSAAKKGKNVKS